MSEQSPLQDSKPTPDGAVQSSDDELDQDTGLSDDEWRRLLTAIQAGKCTPFLGAGASAEHVRGASQIAQDWARHERFPFPNHSELIKVAQYLSVRLGHLDAKTRMVRECDVPRPVFKEGSIYDVLSELNIPIFVTTNYDSLMAYALQTKGKEPQREICRWWQKRPDEEQNSPLKSGFRPTQAQPLVYHFHGHISDVDSLVLNEDDYLEFLTNLAADPEAIPPQIQRALSVNSILFLGYSLADWTIQVIFRSISQYLTMARRPTHLSVQLVPPLGEQPTPEQKRHAREYLADYFGRQYVSVYWGTCERFALELQKRLAQAQT